MTSFRFLVDVNVGLAVVRGLQQSGHDVTFAGDIDWRMPVNVATLPPVP